MQCFDIIVKFLELLKGHPMAVVLAPLFQFSELIAQKETHARLDVCSAVSTERIAIF
jgi:hypothetical protein